MKNYKPIDIFMRPAWIGDNTFTHSLADALINAGHDVNEITSKWSSIPTRPGIVFLHWPDEFFYIKNARLAVKAVIFLIRHKWANAFNNQKLVWLVHNLEPHDGKGKYFFLVKRIFLNSLDGVAFLSQSSRKLFVEKYADYCDIPSVIIHHGHYKRDAINPPTLPLYNSEPILAKYVGRIKRYKAPDILARAALLNPEKLRFTIVGEMHETDLKDELQALAAGSSNITLDVRALSAVDFESEIDSAAVIVMAYRDILNSGSALYALSRNRPFIGPRLGSLVELQQDVGQHWIWLYDGEFTGETFAEAIRWVAETDRSEPPDLSKYEWAKIGQKLSQFLSSL